MEKKRKLPARAAARVEQMAKRRTLTPPERHSETPPPPPEPEPEPTPVREAPAPLPTSIQSGKPLPTVEEPQSDDLPAKDYQSVSESGVLAESLARSRRKWISEGIFEKYWTKPYKKKGVVVEEPNNPPKESMTKIGHQITITVEPHVFDVTMYTVKDPKPPAPPPPPAANAPRPVMQYGPPNGVMPPPPPPAPPATPSTAAASPALAPTQAVGDASKPPLSQPSTPMQPPAQPPPQASQPPQNQQPPQAPSYTLPPQPAPQPAPPQSFASPTQPPASAPVTQMARPMASPRGMESILSPATALSHPHTASRPVMTAPIIGTPPLRNGPPPAPYPPTGGPISAARPAVNGAAPVAPHAKPAPGTDPIILTLAEKAGEDPELRDLMKRVAQGEASKPELERFQAIIDAITAESKRRGTPGPSADRLLFDGKTVRYFADEVRQILDIVLASNPKQESSTLRPPDGSDPLVVKLVKKSLDDIKTRELVTRIAHDRPQFSDATDLKAVLDVLKREIARENERLKKESPAPAAKLNGVANGHMPNTANTGMAMSQQAPQQLRSKGPPPVQARALPDISAVVFEFSGGNGDRYLFPKFSILEYVPVPHGQQVIASFLIVRRGSASEYPVADPALDYYQPVTIRLFTPAGKHLDYLSRVVAPEEEVRRYMNDIMDKMTRAEYILLAMRLPRPETAREQAEATSAEDSDALDKDKGNRWNKQSGLRWINHTSSATATPTPAVAPVVPPTALWTTRPLKPEIRELPPRSKMYSKEALDAMDTDDQYQSFIASVSRKEPEEV
ncbi:hypothetical protein GE09DRAFT_543627 [Coniochaeta sp. 2T2.1]|nr:hypothetical protein GE09DRAFT_543627 [Coniochaeta sp. 2T2.1]